MSQAPRLPEVAYLAVRLCMGEDVQQGGSLLGRELVLSHSATSDGFHVDSDSPNRVFTPACHTDFASSSTGDRYLVIIFCIEFRASRGSFDDVAWAMKR